MGDGTTEIAGIEIPSANPVFQIQSNSEPPAEPIISIVLEISIDNTARR